MDERHRKPGSRLCYNNVRQERYLGDILSGNQVVRAMPREPSMPPLGSAADIIKIAMIIQMKG